MLKDSRILPRYGWVAVGRRSRLCPLTTGVFFFTEFPEITALLPLLQEFFHLFLTLNCCTNESTQCISKPDEGVALVFPDAANFAHPNAQTP